MYIGWREIRDAKGRFALITGVVALLTLMVVMLSALAAGLDAESTSAVRSLPGDLRTQESADGSATSLTDSRVQQEPGVPALGVATTRIANGDHAAAVSAFGRSDVSAVTVDPETAASLGLHAGSTATIGAATVRIDAVADVGKYAHTSVVQMPLTVWQQATGRDGASALLTDRAVPGTVMTAHADLPSLVPGYQSEHSSFLLIQALLVVISAVVVGGFFAVWTGQRVRALAVVRAMGASRRYLLRDGLGQALLVLATGLVVGLAVGGVAAWAASSVVPIAVDPAATATLLAGIGVLGLVGAALALRPLVRVDPLIALNR
ncbi:FtsX-like permease family protein [Gordonia hydrophobica]|uniref:ABC transporter permease n=1 Tax=Gordonia hydrophobica TaxID=40516 RepID=A0ABZ2U244_9ACTN|nr:ABC transporter permease [Gordonia hydrophobica]MBM7366844.1 putative ABC transport system permease protein [Gordonia hydrophobica]